MILSQMADVLGCEHVRVSARREDLAHVCECAATAAAAVYDGYGLDLEYEPYCPCGLGAARAVSGWEVTSVGASADWLAYTGGEDDYVTVELFVEPAESERMEWEILENAERLDRLGACSD